MLPWWACCHVKRYGKFTWGTKAVLSVLMARLMSLKGAVEQQDGCGDADDVMGSIANMGDEDRFRGVIHLITMQTLVYAHKTQGLEYDIAEIPADYRELAQTQRAKMVEALAEVDDAIMELYLADQPVPVEMIRQALRQGTISLQIVPTLCGSAFKKKGVQPLLDAVVAYLPSPEDKPPVKGIGPEGEIVERAASDDEPLAVLAFKLLTDPYVGHLTFLRVYSGVLKSGRARPGAPAIRAGRPHVRRSARRPCRVEPRCRSAEKCRGLSAFR